MRNQGKILALATGMFLAGAAGLPAQASTVQNKAPRAASPTTTKSSVKHITRGTISSLDANQMVVTQKRRGKQEQMTFMLNPETQRQGNVAVGSNVTVQYRVDNNQKLATTIRENQTKTAAKTPKEANKK